MNEVDGQAQVVGPAVAKLTLLHKCREPWFDAEEAPRKGIGVKHTSLPARKIPAAQHQHPQSLFSSFSTSFNKPFYSEEFVKQLQAHLTDAIQEKTALEAELEQDKDTISALHLEPTEVKTKIPTLTTKLGDVTNDKHVVKEERDTRKKEHDALATEVKSYEEEAKIVCNYVRGYREDAAAMKKELKQVSLALRLGRLKSLNTRANRGGSKERYHMHPVLCPRTECNAGTPCFSCTQKKTVCLRNQCETYEKGPNQWSRRDCRLAHLGDEYDNARKMESKNSVA